MMNKIMARYFFVPVLSRGLFIVFAMTMLLLLFDVMANAEDVLAFQDHILSALLIYAGLRLPLIAVTAIPIAVLLSCLMVLSKRVNTQEIIALRAAGFPLYRIAGFLLIAGGLFAVLQFSLANMVAPQSAVLLNQWKSLDYQGTPQIGKNAAPMKAIWFKKGNHLFYVESASADGKYLEGLRYLERDENGMLVRYILAEQALYMGDDWKLSQVREPDFGRVHISNNEDVPQVAEIDIGDGEELTIPLPLQPSVFSYGAETQKHKAEEFGIFDLLSQRDYIAAQGKPAYIYKLWVLQKISQPLACLIMVLIALPIALRISRRGSLLSFGFLLTLCGFFYFIAERILFALAESAQLPVFVASFAAPLTAVIIMAWLALMQERS